MVEGDPGTGGVIEGDLGKAEGSEVVVKQAVVREGKPSKTAWRKLRYANGVSLLEVRPQSGRMHQIRVHFQWLGHPIVGDKLYGHDETLYLEFTQHDWTDRLQANLDARRQLLSLVELKGPNLSWRADVPEDISGFREWGLKDGEV